MMAPMLIEYNVPNCFSIVKILIRQLKQTAIHMMAPIILDLFFAFLFLHRSFPENKLRENESYPQDMNCRWFQPTGY
jgi:hypothetical protein